MSDTQLKARVSWPDGHLGLQVLSTEPGVPFGCCILFSQIHCARRSKNAKRLLEPAELGQHQGTLKLQHRHAGMWPANHPGLVLLDSPLLDLAIAIDFDEDNFVTTFIHIGFIPAKNLAGKSAHA